MSGTDVARYDGAMSRWPDDARTRLAAAAVDLYLEQGYDRTTVAQVAARAGVTERTYFRHFPDKREVLVAGQEVLSHLLAEGIAQAPPGASALEAVAAGLERASSAMGPANRELGPRLRAAVAASAELQERDALKSVGLAAAMTGLPGGGASFIAVSILAFVILGSVLEGIPAIVLFGPLLFPIAKAVGVHEVHYAMIIILAMGIGLFAPPFGVGYYAACAIGRVDPAEGMRPIWGYMLALLIGLAIVAIFPWISIGFL